MRFTNIMKVEGSLRVDEDPDCYNWKGASHSIVVQSYRPNSHLCLEIDGPKATVGELRAKHTRAKNMASAVWINIGEMRQIPR